MGKRGRLAGKAGTKLKMGRQPKPPKGQVSPKGKPLWGKSHSKPK